MARARNIKPAFFQNELLVEMSFEYRLLFIGLWTLADREGRLEDRPKRIKMGLFPADNIDIDDGLNELQSHGFIHRYEVNGEKLVQIVNFTKHQNPHHTEKASELPDCNGEYPKNTAKKTENKQAKPVKKPELTESNPDNNGALTVKPPLLDGGNPADSLIPDSLIPDSLEDIRTAEADAQKTERAKAAKDLDYSSWPAKPSAPVLKDWLAMRKTKRAPVSQTVINRLSRQFSLAAAAGWSVDDCLAECITRGWTGFEYQWLANARASPQARTKQPHSFEHQNYESGVL